MENIPAAFGESFARKDLREFWLVFVRFVNWLTVCIKKSIQTKTRSPWRLENALLCDTKSTRLTGTKSVEWTALPRSHADERTDKKNGSQIAWQTNTRTLIHAFAKRCPGCSEINTGNCRTESFQNEFNMLATGFLFMCACAHVLFVFFREQLKQSFGNKGTKVKRGWIASAMSARAHTFVHK